MSKAKKPKQTAVRDFGIKLLREKGVDIAPAQFDEMMGPYTDGHFPDWVKCEFCLRILDTWDDVHGCCLMCDKICCENCGKYVDDTEPWDDKERGDWWCKEHLPQRA